MNDKKQKLEKPIYMVTLLDSPDMFHEISGLETIYSDKKGNDGVNSEYELKKNGLVIHRNKLIPMSGIEMLLVTNQSDANNEHFCVYYVFPNFYSISQTGQISTSKIEGSELQKFHIYEGEELPFDKKLFLDQALSKIEADVLLLSPQFTDWFHSAIITFMRFNFK